MCEHGSRIGAAAPITISAAARRVGLTPRAIRLYEARGLLSPARDPADVRLYDEDDLARLEEVSQLRRIGFPIAEIVATLAARDRQGPASAAARTLAYAQRRLAAVEAQRRELEALIAALASSGPTIPHLTHAPLPGATAHHPQHPASLRERRSIRA